MKNYLEKMFSTFSCACSLEKFLVKEKLLTSQWKISSFYWKNISPFKKHKSFFKNQIFISKFFFLCV